MPLTGSLPALWGSDGSFPSLSRLYLGNRLLKDNIALTPLTGNLPPEWANPSALSALTELGITSCTISGVSAAVPCHMHDTGNGVTFLQQACVQSDGRYACTPHQTDSALFILYLQHRSELLEPCICVA